MKKIFLIGVTIISIILIYLLTLDNKVYFFSIGDSIALGKMDNELTENNYSYYVYNDFKMNNNLQKYVKEYVQSDIRINDIINDINNNKKILVDDREYNIKNILIKSDLVTISVNHEDVLNKLSGNYSVQELYDWIDELIRQYELMLSLLRNYCKERIMVVGYYYPKILLKENKKIKVISYLNDKFKEISFNYDVQYIDVMDLFLETDDTTGNYYPTEVGYKLIADQIISKFQTSN